METNPAPAPIAPETAYVVIDSHTGRVVYRTTYAFRGRARAFANRKDLEYGAVRYLPSFVR